MRKQNENIPSWQKQFLSECSSGHVECIWQPFRIKFAKRPKVFCLLSAKEQIKSSLKKTFRWECPSGHVEKFQKCCRKKCSIIPKFFCPESEKKKSENFFLRKLFPSKPASRHVVCSHGNNARKVWPIFTKNPKLFASKSKSDEIGPCFLNEFFQSLPPGFFNAVVTTLSKFFHQTVEKSSLWAWNYCINYTSDQNVFSSLKRSTGHVDFRPDNFDGAFCWKYGKILHKSDIVEKNSKSHSSKFPLCT